MLHDGKFRGCLEHGNLTEIVQEFHKNQFIFIEKTQIQRKTPAFQAGP
jgi:hypothetical protein